MTPPRLSAPITETTLRWIKDLQFEGGGPGQPGILVDGDTRVATSPVQLLLLAAASCTASDIVIILQKQRIELESLEISVRGTRREEPPRRITAMALQVSVRGKGADELKVRRAIDLSIEKYCSVIASLAPDIPVTYDVTIV